MFENVDVLDMAANVSAFDLSDRVEQTELDARFHNFVAAHGWTRQQEFRAAYREIRRAINVEDADSAYTHYRHTKQLPDYVLAFMDGTSQTKEYRVSVECAADHIYRSSLSRSCGATTVVVCGRQTVARHRACRR